MTDPAGTRSARKLRAIVDAAEAAFLRGGYLGTNMDEIAAAAGVSKQTVYKHFAGKAGLFQAVVAATVTAASDPVAEGIALAAGTDDVRGTLHALARRQLELVLQPRMMRLRRLVIAEAGRFPELGRAFHEQGPARTVDALAAVLARLAERGLLEVDDAPLAARQFNWLVMSAPLNRAMLLGEDGPPDPADVERWAGEGVRTFLAAYGRGRVPVNARNS
ncbi:MAG: TetR/AcrR family transcriptional regulator [Pseudonocardia sp.]